jgi:branched-subunit amino acid transport protein
MSIGLILLIAALTYGSRALGLVVMPTPPARVQSILDRIPAPLFAALAATSLIEDGAFVGASTLTAALFALSASPTRSLLWVLVAGVAGYAVGALIFT